MHEASAVRRWRRCTLIPLLLIAGLACSSEEGDGGGSVMLFPDAPPSAAGTQAGTDMAAGGAMAAPMQGTDVGIGPSGEGPAALPEGVDVETPVAADPQVGAELVGSYAVRMTQRDTVTVGLAGSASMRTIVLATAEIEDDPDSDALQLTMALCQYQIAPDAMEKHLTDLTLSVPAAALETIALDPTTLNAGQGEGDAMVWQTGELLGAGGWRWESAADALPESAEDPRVFDQDEDGQPGVTALFTGHTMGALYLAMAYRWQLAGVVADNGELVGSNVSTCTEKLLGTDQNEVIVNSFERVPDPDNTDNTVRFVRQEAPIACADVLTRVTELFP